MATRARGGGQHQVQLCADGLVSDGQGSEQGGYAEDKAYIGNVAAHDIADHDIGMVLKEGNKADKKLGHRSAEGYHRQADKQRAHTPASGKPGGAGDQKFSPGAQHDHTTGQGKQGRLDGCRRGLHTHWAMVSRK